MKIYYSILVPLFFSFSCSQEHEFDASGTFEGEEIIISSQAAGTVEQLTIDEGDVLMQGAWIGYVDSTQLHLKRKQLEAQIAAILSKQPDISRQIASLRTQLAAAKVKQERIQNMAEKGAATPQQLDDANAGVQILKDRINAQLSALRTSSGSLGKETLPLQIRIRQLDDQIDNCRLINPVAGTVLTQYVEQHEVVQAGKPLYKIAPLDTLILRAYVTGDQLNGLRLNQRVAVLVDKGEEAYKTYKGRLTWISDKAEFTPKSIQTKEERVNLVYAVKIKVANDGFLKIGMYGEVKFTENGSD